MVSQSGAKHQPPPKPVVKIDQTPSQPTEEDESWSAPVMSEEEKAKDDTTDLVDALLKNRANRPPLTEKEKKVKAALKEFKNKPVEINVPKQETEYEPVLESTLVKPVEKKVVKEEAKKEPGRSNLSSVIEKMGEPKDEQAKKVLDIINSVDKGKEK